MTDEISRSLSDLLEVSLRTATRSETRRGFSQLIASADRSLEFEGGLTPVAAVLRTYERRLRRLSAGPLADATAQLLDRLRSHDRLQVVGFAGNIGDVDFVVFVADDESEMIGCIVSDVTGQGE